MMGVSPELKSPVMNQMMHHTSADSAGMKNIQRVYRASAGTSSNCSEQKKERVDHHRFLCSSMSQRLIARCGDKVDVDGTDVRVVCIDGPSPNEVVAGCREVQDERDVGEGG